MKKWKGEKITKNVQILSCNKERKGDGGGYLNRVLFGSGLGLVSSDTKPKPSTITFTYIIPSILKW